MHLPNDIEILKGKVQKILNPVRPTEKKGTKTEESFVCSAKRTNAGRKLPPYYLIYFLFVDLLGYENLGRFEKIAWAVPIDCNGTVYFLEHRKMGMGLFATNRDYQEDECLEIVKKIKKAIKVAHPYFEWFANNSAKRSKLNVLNYSERLYGRYEFLLTEHKKKIEEAISWKNETQHSDNLWNAYKLKRESEWLALSAIDAFYGFTEHIFILASILRGQLLTGEDVANLADKNWASKFKECLDIEDNTVKLYYDKLITIKRQIRNYMAHGAFGKNGEAFQIHSGAGAVPLLMPHQKGSSRFSMRGGTEFREEEAISAIEEFMRFYWDSSNFPEVLYIKSRLPCILTYASNSTYKNAITSIDNMRRLVDHLTGIHDRAGDMDW